MLTFAALLLVACEKERKADIADVLQNFATHSDKIVKVEYKIQRIDTSVQGKVLNHTGVALIEKDKTDELFGLSFYGKRDDVPKEYIYDKGIGFEVSREEKSYRMENRPRGFLGSPGGQMILQNLFAPDSVYKSISLAETEKRYLIKYEFADDTVYNLTDIVKTVELRKGDFFPVKIALTSTVLGNRTSTQFILSDIRTNGQVPNSIKNYKSEFSAYDVIQPKERQPNRLLQKMLPEIRLPKLSDKTEIVELPFEKLTLIDFWEVWCGPCIASFPKVEHLKNAYATKLEVVGIVSEDSESAIRLIEKKGTTFLNLIGNDELKEKFTVDSYPRYFLVDKNGIVQKEYIGFSDKIEEDVIKLLGSIHAHDIN
jgi:thiol-disulfide isomerase/thioredoxin